MNNCLYSAYRNESWLFKLAFSLLLFAPLALILGISWIEIVISGVSILFLIKCILEKNFSWLNEVWVKIFLLLWAYMIIRGFFTINPKLAVVESLSFIRFALLALAVQHWLLKKSSARITLIMALSITIFFAVIDGLIQFFTHVDLFNNQLTESQLKANRLTAPSGKMNIGADLVMLLFPAICYLFNLAGNSNKIFHRTASYLAIAAIITFIPITGERNTSLLLLLGLFLLFIGYKSAQKYLLIITISSILFLYGFLQFHEELNIRLTQTIGRVVTSIMADSKEKETLYSALIKTDWNIFTANPLFGIGRKQFLIYCEQADPNIALTKRDYNVCITNPQNIYLEWLCEAGIIGTLLFFTIPFLWLRKCYANRRIILANPIAIGVLIEILIRLWPFGITSSFFLSWWGGPFWLMAGWLLLYADESTPLSREETLILKS